MNTLFITFTYLKGNRGAIYASRTHINLFSELSEKMTLLYPYKEGMEPEGINSEKIELIPVEDHRSNIKKFVDLCLGKRHRFVGFAEQFIDPSKYDIVVFDSSLASSKLIDKFTFAGIKAITIHHNYEIEYIKGDSNGIIKYPSLFWTYFQEGKAVRKSVLNLTLTNQDAELFRKNYERNANCETLGVFDYQRREYSKVDNKDRGHHYVITGGLGSKQNEESLIPWFEYYYPILKKVDPLAKLTLAGRDPSAILVKMAECVGAEIIPNPIDMGPILASGDYYICPTDRGGGLKLRIMDGLKVGMPVLTHAVSARGYDRFVQSKVVFPYHDAVSFECGLREMLSGKMTQSEIQQTYIDNFSLDKGVDILKNILKKNNILN